MEKTAESLDWICKALQRQHMGADKAPPVFKTKEQRQIEGKRNNNPLLSSGLPDSSMYVIANYFSYFSTKTYVVGTHKNHVNDTVKPSQ